MLSYPGSEPLYLACNVYLWTLQEQSDFLVRCLLPAAVELRESGALSELWFNRFDARGPHLLVLVRPAAGESDRVKSFLSSTFRHWLSANPSAEAGPSREELHARHEACRGKTLCEADHLPGFAERHSFIFVPHSDKTYPYFRTGIADPASQLVWRELTDTVLWVIGCLSRPIVAPAIRWLAQLDASLSDREARGFWLYALQCVLPEEDRLKVEPDGSPPLDLVETLIGSPKNRALVESVWDAGLSTAPDPSDLVKAALAEQGPGPEWRLLREVVFTTLKQMGLIVSRHVPLYAFALLRRHQDQETAG